MKISPTKFQASFFTNTEDLRPTADVIPKLLEAVRNVAFLPTTFHEVSVSSRTRFNEPLLRFTSENGEWEIDFQMARINFAKVVVGDPSAEMGSLEEFQKDVLGCLRQILERFERKAYRLASVVTAFLDDCSDEELDASYGKFVNRLGFYEKHEPAAWEAQSVARVEQRLRDSNEMVNVITTLKRVQGRTRHEDRVEEFDKLLFESDVNTFQGRLEPRFELADFDAFQKLAGDIRSEVLRDVETRLND